MRVLVTGGTGFLGGHVARALLARGDLVRLLVRSPSAAAALVEVGAEVVPGDLRSASTVAAACAGVDAVCHAGALSSPWGKAADFHAINVRGTENVVIGCRAHGVSRLVYVSSPAVVFDGRDQLNVTEAVPFPRRFTSVYAYTKKLGEDRVNAARCEGLSTVILRPKAIYGPGDSALLPRIVSAARQGRLTQIGAGGNCVDFTYVDNVVHAVLTALDSRTPAGGTYTITNGEPVMLWELIRRVLAHVGCRARLRRVSIGAAQVAACLMEARAAVTGREPLLTRYTVAILSRTQTYDLSAARLGLGYRPIVSMEEGVRRTLAALKTETPDA
ncbi:MAG: NAD-dependent epimerase/dehydratase family protein [Actinomycetota bacterium]